VAISPGDADDLAAETAAAYTEAEVSALGRIAKLLGLNIDKDSWSAERRNSTGVVRRIINSLLGKVFAKGRRAADKAIKDAAARGVDLANQELGDAVDSTPGSVDYLVDAAKRKAAKDLKAVEKAVNAQVMTVYQRIITEVTGAVTNGTSTRLAAARVAINKFADEGVTGFVDKSGRRWELATYVEMAIRTNAANVMIDAHLAALADADIHLVMVSTGPYSCKLCDFWEGKILEVDGTAGEHTVTVVVRGKKIKVKVNGSLEEARAAGLLHPNCKHNIAGYVPGVTAAPEKPDTKGVTYEDTQKLRALERAARKWDRRRAVALTPEDRAVADAKLKAYLAEIRDYVAKTGLPRKTNRERHNGIR
jgi:hypothetical protein